MLSSTSEQKASDTSPLQHNSYPKKEGADEADLCRLISLIHRIEKVLAPTNITVMEKLVDKSKCFHQKEDHSLRLNIC